MPLPPYERLANDDEEVPDPSGASVLLSAGSVREPGRLPIER